MSFTDVLANLGKASSASNWQGVSTAQNGGNNDAQRTDAQKAEVEAAAKTNPDAWNKSWKDDPMGSAALNASESIEPLLSGDESGLNEKENITTDPGNTWLFDNINNGEGQGIPKISVPNSSEYDSETNQWKGVTNNPPQNPDNVSNEYNANTAGEIQDKVNGEKETKDMTFDEVAQKAGVSDDELQQFMTGDRDTAANILSNWITSNNGLGKFYGEAGDEYGQIDKTALANGDTSSLYAFIDAMKADNPLYNVDSDNNITVGKEGKSLLDVMGSNSENSDMYLSALLNEALMKDKTVGNALLSVMDEKSMGADGKSSMADVLGVTKNEGESYTDDQIRQLADGLAAYNALKSGYNDEDVKGFSGTDLNDRLNDYLNLSSNQTKIGEGLSNSDILSQLASSNATNTDTTISQDAQTAMDLMNGNFEQDNNGNITKIGDTPIESISGDYQGSLKDVLDRISSEPVITGGNQFDWATTDQGKENDLVDTIKNIRNDAGNNNSLQTLQALYGNLLNQDSEGFSGNSRLVATK